MENSGGSSGVYGVYNEDVSPRLVHVTVEVSAVSSPAFGIFNVATVGTPSAPELRQVTVAVDGDSVVIGVLNQTEANTRMHDVRVLVGGGGNSSNKSGVFNNDAEPAFEDVEVTVESTGSGGINYGIFNQSVPEFLLDSFRVEVRGGEAEQYGVYNDSVLTLRDFEVDVSGDGVANYGVSNEGSTAAALEGCHIAVEGRSVSGGGSIGVRYFDSSGELRDCTVEVTDGSGTEQALDGFDSTGKGSYGVDVEHSRLTGPEAAVDGSSTFTIRIGASKLDGAVTGAASYTCVNAYDGAFAERNTDCSAVSP